jgi:3-hydroxybutyryl-CoA dehydrogenase
MTIAVLADEGLKNELLARDVRDDVNFVWADSLRALTIIEADLYMDLLFELDNERTSRLKQLLSKPVLVNAVPYTTNTIGQDFIRINAWPTFLQRDILEIALPAAVSEETIAPILNEINWKYTLVPDIAGMITPRVVSMIINEAYYTLGDGVSTREEIDVAMKLGTNYPMGPFEWAGKIGLHRVYELLKEMGRTDERYAIAPALLEEIQNG